MLRDSVTAQEAILVPAEGTDFDMRLTKLEIALLTTALRRTGAAKPPPRA